MFFTLKRQLSIIGALTVREMTTRYGNKFGGYMWAIIDPIATVAILSLVFSAVAHIPPLGRSFPLFFATGYNSFLIYRSMSEQVSASVSSNMALLSYPIVHPYDTIAARVILQVATLFVVNLLFFFGLSLIDPIPAPNMGPVMLASAIGICLGTGVGMINVVGFHLSSTYQQIFGIINRPAFIVSGVFFLPENIPHPYREYLLWNPLVHIVGLFRTGFYPTYRAGYIDLPWLIGVSVGTLVLGFVLVWLYDAKLREAQ